MSFNTEAKVDGINATEFMNDPALGESYIDAMSATTNVSADSITIVNITDADDIGDERRYLRASVSRELATSGVLIETEIKVILEKIGKKSTDGQAVFDTLSESVSTSVSIGSFGKKLDKAAAARGVTKPVVVDKEFPVTNKPPVIVQQRTATPTAVPTLSPTPGPTAEAVDEDDDSDGFSLFGLETGASIGALVGIIVGLFVMLGTGVYILTGKSSGKGVISPGVPYTESRDAAIVKTNTGQSAAL